MVTIEQVLDVIADKLIVSAHVNPEVVAKNQKSIVGGRITVGTSGTARVLFEEDKKANLEDLKTSQSVTDSSGNTFEQTFEHVVQEINDLGPETTISSVDITIESGRIKIYNAATATLLADVTDLLSTVIVNDDGDETILNPLNVSQFFHLTQLSETIDVGLANEYLDTNIWELLPGVSARQDKVDQFFDLFANLIGPVPDFNVAGSPPMVDEDFSANDYSGNNDISTFQNMGIPDHQSSITRLNAHANNRNQGKTLESLRDILNTYLKDIDQEYPDPEDLRPTYSNKSSGYLKFRQLNQGIIIRNTNKDFIQSLNPNNPTYLETGFTITMWVRFLDKISEGTLFNFGNPLRGDTGMGFMLDTYVLQKEQEDNINYGFPENGYYDENGNSVTSTFSVLGPNNPNGALFSNTNTERFVRLLVNENGTLRDSSVPSPNFNSQPGVPMQGFNNYNYITDQEDFNLAPNLYNTLDGDNPQFHNPLGLFNNVKIPYSPSEWYFICATYNPDIKEDESHDQGWADWTWGRTSPDFWRGNQNLDESYTDYSGYGNRCKVEIISRTDLLRARGYKV